MKHVLLLLAALFFATSALAQSAQKETITIFTGGPRGTYFKFGEDIKRACSNLDVQVVSTSGSLENLNMLVTAQPLKVGSRFALVQSDVLSGIIGDQRRIDGVIEVIQPLYTEAVTIVVNKLSGISGLADLQGKRVAVGVRGSGVWFTSSALKSILGMEWIQIEKSNEESILSLLVGDIDAMIMVAGHPFGVYRDLPASVKSNIEFINIRDDKLNRLYKNHVLESDIYNWQTTKVHTISTRSLFVSARDASESSKNELLKCLTLSQNELRRWGHPKWNDVPFTKKRKKHG